MGQGTVLSQLGTRMKSIVMSLWLAFALIFAACGNDNNDNDLYLGIDPPPPSGDIPAVPTGVTGNIVDDWQRPIPDTGEPSRSYRNIWVRMFPILSAPYRDPYPLTQNIDRVDLYNSGTLRVYSQTTKSLLGEGQSVKFFFDQDRITIDGQRISLERVWISPINPAITTTARWDRGRTNAMKLELRGQFVVQPTTHSKNLIPESFIDYQQDFGEQMYSISWMLMAEEEPKVWSLVNVLPVNDYLLSVVPSEVILSWHQEALKAQAIAARTYALFEMMESREIIKRSWDVDPTTWFQSYRGHSFQKGNSAMRRMEVPRTTSAVNDTADLALFYNGDIIKAYFSSNSGGLTCTASECFDLPTNPDYLVVKSDIDGIKEETGETGTWGRRSSLTKSNIIGKLRQVGVRTSGFKQIRNGVRGPSTRTWQIAVEYTDGTEILLSRADSRKIMPLFGPIRSYLYELSPMSGGVQQVVGHGFGHGVGMSQWGAQLHAVRGYSAREIVTFYYDSTDLVDMASGAVQKQ